MAMPMSARRTKQTKQAKQTMSNAFTLRDTFNDRNVSNHRTLRAVIEAERKLLRAVRRHNGSGSYLATQILCNGEPMTLAMLDEATDIRINLQAGR